MDHFSGTAWVTNGVKLQQWELAGKQKPHLREEVGLLFPSPRATFSVLGVTRDGGFYFHINPTSEVAALWLVPIAPAFTGRKAIALTRTSVSPVISISPEGNYVVWRTADDATFFYDVRRNLTHPVPGEWAAVWLRETPHGCHLLASSLSSPAANTRGAKATKAQSFKLLSLAADTAGNLSGGVVQSAVHRSPAERNFVEVVAAFYNTPYRSRRRFPLLNQVLMTGSGKRGLVQGFAIKNSPSWVDTLKSQDRVVWATVAAGKRHEHHVLPSESPVFSTWSLNERFLIGQQGLEAGPGTALFDYGSIVAVDADSGRVRFSWKLGENWRLVTFQERTRA